MGKHAKKIISGDWNKDGYLSKQNFLFTLQFKKFQKIFSSSQRKIF